MKILIMGLGKIKFMPYMNFYLDNIDREKNDVHILYWNRDLHKEDVSHLKGTTLHEFKCYQQDDVPKLSKISSFIKYRRFALEVLKQEKFDFLVVVHSLTGVVVWDYIRKNFGNKFIFDYRDVTFEKYSFFKKIVADLVGCSKITFVSSNAFRKFLPQKENSKIFTCHNIDTKALQYAKSHEKAFSKSEKIRLGFWGFIRDEQLNYKIIEKLGNDERFELHYYGREQQIAEKLKNYVKENSIENVFFHGEYKPEDRYEFINNTDLIHNLYDDAGAMLAVGNKYYDGIVFKVPQVCMEGSFMAELCKKNGVGFECNPYDNAFAEDLYKKFNKIDKLQFKGNCNKTCADILKEHERNIALLNSDR